MKQRGDSANQASVSQANNSDNSITINLISQKIERSEQGGLGACPREI